MKTVYTTAFPVHDWSDNPFYARIQLDEDELANLSDAVAVLKRSDYVTLIMLCGATRFGDAAFNAKHRLTSYETCVTLLEGLDEPTVYWTATDASTDERFETVGIEASTLFNALGDLEDVAYFNDGELDQGDMQADVSEFYSDEEFSTPAGGAA